jgi:hypothetical protein
MRMAPLSLENAPRPRSFVASALAIVPRRRIANKILKYLIEVSFLRLRLALGLPPKAFAISVPKAGAGPARGGGGGGVLKGRRGLSYFLVIL